MKEFIPVIVVVTILVVILISWYYNKKSRFKRIFKKAPLKKIDKIKNGQVAKFIGEVEFAGEALRAPLSNRECSYYYILVEEEVHSGKSTHWEKIIEEELNTDFIVNDGSSLAFINNKDIKSYIVLDMKYKSGTFNDASQHLESFLSQRGFESEGFLGFNKSLRYREGIIEKGEKIAVLGKCNWKNTEELSLNVPYDRVLTVSSTPESPIYLSDDPDFTKIEYPKFNRKNYRKIS